MKFLRVLSAPRGKEIAAYRSATYKDLGLTFLMVLFSEISVFDFRRFALISSYESRSPNPLRQRDDRHRRQRQRPGIIHGRHVTVLRSR
jgi:hypothetical protein